MVNELRRDLLKRLITPFSSNYTLDTVAETQQELPNQQNETGISRRDFTWKALGGSALALLGLHAIGCGSKTLPPQILQDLEYQVETPDSNQHPYAPDTAQDPLLPLVGDSVLFTINTSDPNALIEPTDTSPAPIPFPQIANGETYTYIHKGKFTVWARGAGLATSKEIIVNPHREFKHVKEDITELPEYDANLTAITETQWNKILKTLDPSLQNIVDLVTTMSTPSTDEHVLEIYRTTAGNASEGNGLTYKMKVDNAFLIKGMTEYAGYFPLQDSDLLLIDDAKTLVEAVDTRAGVDSSNKADQVYMTYNGVGVNGNGSLYEGETNTLLDTSTGLDQRLADLLATSDTATQGGMGSAAILTWLDTLDDGLAITPSNAESTSDPTGSPTGGYGTLFDFKNGNVTFYMDTPDKGKFTFDGFTSSNLDSLHTLVQDTLIKNYSNNKTNSGFTQWQSGIPHNPTTSELLTQDLFY